MGNSRPGATAAPDGIAVATTHTRRARLSVCGKTANSGDRLEHWITRAREYADEIVLLVDEVSADDTLDVALANADRVVAFEHSTNNEAALDFGLRQATGDWVLWLDDDEFLAKGFGQALPALLGNSRVTHYYLPYRWLLRDGDGRYGWVKTFPWYPNPRLRLIRNVTSLYWHRGRPHSPYEVLGDGDVLEGDDVTIYHLDFLLRDRVARERKVAAYRQRVGPSCEEYYLWEDYASTLAVEPVDISEIVRPPSPEARRRAAERSSRGSLRPPERVSAEALRRSVACHWPNADIYHATYGEHTTPPQVLANRGYTVEITLANLASLPWRNSGTGPGRVVLGYHWVHPDHGVLVRDGDTTLLPVVVPPGGKVTVAAGLWTPYDPGPYTLQWDLRAEGVNWFSERGVPPLEVSVTVSEHDRLMARHRPAASVPPRAKAAVHRRGDNARRAVRSISALVRLARHQADLAGTNVVPVKLWRILDTRDGTGTKGAVTGPISAGAVITLQVAGYGLVPDHAVGVVANLAVPDATYNGFVTVFPTDGSSGSSAVGTYFTDDGRPTANQVVAPLGTGPFEGQISLRLSDNHPGTAQLLVDVSAYLA
ncbi:MAG TPA: glycosyltransferase [Acidimicrobiales bacterium]|jgi:hypothetical protein|nr:glycosyltransferase [Acidimicrobiales bacterium]